MSKEFPQRPRSHITGDIGQTATALIFKQWGWTADFISSDYGEDLDCNIFIRNQRTALHFRCQVKSTAGDKQYIHRLRSGDFSVSIDVSVAKTWLISYFPVLLVVYDESKGEAYWINATEDLRKHLEKLSQKSVSIRVSHLARLRENRASIEGSVQQFYAQMLRLSEPILTCEVFPILMPGYRAVPFHDLLELKREDLGKKLNPSPITKSNETLPAWTATLRSLTPGQLHGWKLSLDNGTLDDLLDDMRELFSHIKLKISSGEWLSFVCTPVQFSARENEKSPTDYWSKELVDWWSYSSIKRKVFSDASYAFDVPKGFLRQIARRARSWETYHHVDPKKDLAIELFASVATTPSYKAEIATYRQHMLSQFLPWLCPTDKIEDLRNTLLPLELLFREIKGLKSPRGIKPGAICNLFFEPDVRLYGMSRSWNEFSRGSVREKLEKASLIQRIPGKEGGSDIRDFIISMFGYSTDEPPDHLLISERHYVQGLPIDHSQRIISVQRFRSMKKLDKHSANRKLEDCKIQVSSLLTNPEEIHTEVEQIDSFAGEPIYKLSVSWRPNLNESSAESFTRLSSTFLYFFDGLMPRKRSNAGHLQTTFEVLRFAGEVYFEGEDPFGLST